ncbi:hypothetical protein [Acetobacter sp.]|uniref:glycine-rich domain-containing protein n=1 Tax=Acetobacter sp. TaxID=440 RepID=UPI0039ECF6E9
MVYRIDDTTAVASLPALPTDSIGTPGYFTGGSTTGGAPTRVRYWWLNMVQEELAAFPAAAGMAFDKSNNGQTLAAAKALFLQTGATALQTIAGPITHAGILNSSTILNLTATAAGQTCLFVTGSFVVNMGQAASVWVPTVALGNNGINAASTAFVLATIKSIAWATALSSTSPTPPSWAKSIEIKMDGGGGGGSSCQGSSLAADVSGSGGGAGGHIWGIYPITSGQTVSLVIGSGGGSQAAGGTSSISIGGTVVASAGGGGAGSFQSAASSPGGIGGTATGGNLLNMPGGQGSDGQCFGWASFGNGAPSRWGSPGRAGNGGGNDAAGYGSGGGGAYDARMTNTLYYGGAGKQGMAEYRFLPF